MNQSTTEQDPFSILGIDSNASEQEIRQRYLALIKLNPPETHPEKFREIHAAYESAKDPLVLAERLLEPSLRIPKWNDVIEQQKKRPPNLGADLLIALGNVTPTAVKPTNDRVDTAHE